MRETREGTGHSQSKFAAMLGLSDRAYKNYELGKREVPLSTLIKFAQEFEVEFDWLVFGDQMQPKDAKLMNLAVQTSEATYALATDLKEKPMSIERYVKFFEYVLDQSRVKVSIPSHEARAVFELIRSENAK
ncbi:helix-turn-helix domain-containing protein [Rhodophyticola sp. CCM32]|uniref:helix-turn-helix domain-containing protein n=1 Tax=Rhodophyticola sp. CCM32 TaxID=2916397 RepID=UPI00143D03AA|nr:helix-turn-helix transcriptional regulator [Rhodophyticola sp. CCM32]